MTYKYKAELGFVTDRPYSFAHVSVVADDMEELEYKLGLENAKLAQLVSAAWVEGQAVMDLTVGGLKPEVEETIHTPVPSKPWEKKADAAPAKPWEKKGAAPAAAQKPDTASGNSFRVSFPYIDDEDMAKQRKEFMQSFYVEFKNSLSFDRDEKLYKFFRQPDQKTIDALKGGLDYFDGEIVSE